MNNVSIIGRITNELILSNTRDGKPALVFSIAINHGDFTDFVPCTCYGGTAETVAKHFEKGQRIGISGHLHSYVPSGEKLSKLIVVVDTFSWCD